jgi:hypothetical protein
MKHGSPWYNPGSLSGSFERVSRTRITQIFNLLNLAPEIQERYFRPNRSHRCTRDCTQSANLVQLEDTSWHA